MGPAPRDQLAVSGLYSGKDRADLRQIGNGIETEQSCAKRIVEIMRQIGDVVGQVGKLRLGRTMRAKLKLQGRIERGNRRADGRTVSDRAIMLDHTFQRFPGEVQPVKGGIALFKCRDHANSLLVMIEPAEIPHRGLKRVFASMAERGVAQIVGERHRLGKIVIQAKRTRHRPRDLRNLDGMRHAGAEIVTLVIDENLRLVFQPSERSGMQDAVAVTLERRAAGQCVGQCIGQCIGHRAGFAAITALARLVMLPSTALRPMAGIGGKIARLAHGILGCG